MKFLKTNWYWLIPLVALVVAIAVSYWQKNKALAAGIKTTDPATGKDLDLDTVLYAGIQGKAAEIMALQQYLNQYGGTLTVDGIFGPATTAELYKQKKVFSIALKNLL